MQLSGGTEHESMLMEDIWYKVLIIVIIQCLKYSLLVFCCQYSLRDMKIVQFKYLLNYFSWKVMSSLSLLWMNMNAIFPGILSWQYVAVIITNMINTITDILCYPMLYKLCRNTSVVIILSVLRGNQYPYYCLYLCVFCFCFCIPSPGLLLKSLV